MEKFQNFIAGIIIPFLLFFVFIRLPSSWISTFTSMVGPHWTLILYYSVLFIICLFILAFIQNKIPVKEYKTRMVYFTGAYILGVLLAILSLTIFASLFGNFRLY